MEIYYYETDNGHGSVHYADDLSAVNGLRKQFKESLMVIYKESNTENGQPFIILYERSK